MGGGGEAENDAREVYEHEAIAARGWAAESKGQGGRYDSRAPGWTDADRGGAGGPHYSPACG